MFDLKLYTQELKNLLALDNYNLKTQVVYLNFWEFIYCGWCPSTNMLNYYKAKLTTEETDVKKISYFSAKLQQKELLPIPFINLTGNSTALDGIHRMFAATKTFPQKKFPVLICYTQEKDFNQFLEKLARVEDKIWPKI